MDKAIQRPYPPSAKPLTPHPAARLENTMTAPYRSWLRLLAPLLKCRLRPGAGTIPPRSLPMAVLRDETLAYKPDKPADAPFDAARLPPSIPASPSAAVRAAAAAPASRPATLATPKSKSFGRTQPLLRTLRPTGHPSHTMPSSPFVLSGTIQNVCDQLEQWAAQEDHWLRAG